MTWHILGAREIHQNAPIWRRLAAQMSARHPTLEAEFLLAASRLLVEAPLRVHLAYHVAEDGAVDTAALLERLNFAMWRILTTAHLPVAPIIGGAAQANPQSSVNSLLRSLPGMALFLRIKNWDPDYSPRLDSAVCKESVPTHTTVRIDIAGRFDDYWSSRSKNLRRNIRALQNKLESEGLSPKLIVLQTPSEIDSAIAEHGRLEETGWKRRAGKPLSKGDVETDFYLELLRSLATRNCARIFQLYLGEKLAASQFGVIAGSTLALLKTGYDDGLARFAPGRLLDYFMLQHLFAEKSAERVEYCTIANEDDVRWSTSQRQVFEIEIFRHTLVKNCIAAMRNVKHAIRTRNRKT
jgi:CelD/BcsL family acetyltransferase involved in cellulose biosynthesis